MRSQMDDGMEFSEVETWSIRMDLIVEQINVDRFHVEIFVELCKLCVIYSSFYVFYRMNEIFRMFFLLDLFFSSVSFLLYDSA